MLRELPVVSIVGRPNVGKSTLFNRLVGKRKTIVHQESGTTRDFIREFLEWNGVGFYLLDTGGVEFTAEKEKNLQVQVEKQVRMAVAESELILFVVDLSSEITRLDELMAAELRKTKKKVFVVVNKVDNLAKEYETSVFYQLGFSDVFSLSALHGHGTGDLLDSIVKFFPTKSSKENVEPAFTMAIVGEPNSGKSTYLNRILNEERVIVSEIPGTTRDAIEEIFYYKGKPIRLVDTAGLKLKKKVTESVTFYSINRTQEAIRNADVALLFFDAERGFALTSKTIASFIHEEGRAFILVANKWDLVKMSTGDYEKVLKQGIPFLKRVPLIFISAKEGKNIEAPLQKAEELAEKSRKKITTSTLNSFLEVVSKKNPPPPSVRLRYLVQRSVFPPKFVLFVKRCSMVPEDYRIYLENQLLELFELNGIPVRLELREVTGKKKVITGKKKK